jgi:flagellar assembly factor FliW
MSGLSTHDGAAVFLPLGLLGFEDRKHYQLIGHPDEAPFLWLRDITDPSQAFLVLPPTAAGLDYRPVLSHTDVEFLQLRAPTEAEVLNIVTLRRDGRATINLKGPLVINSRTRIGKQVVPENAAEFSTQHPLPIAT